MRQEQNSFFEDHCNRGGVAEWGLGVLTVAGQGCDL